MRLHHDLDLADSKPAFLHDTLAHDDSSPYQVWLLKVSSWGNILSRWTFAGYFNLYCDFDLDHNSAIWSFHKTIQLMMMCYQTKFSFKRSAVQNIYQNVIFWFNDHSLESWLWRQQSDHFEWHYGSLWCTTIPRLVVNGSENIVWTNIHWYLKVLLWPWPWTQQCNFFIRYSGLW